MRLSIYQFLRVLYWALRGNRAVAPHMLGTLCSFVQNAVRLFQFRQSSRKRRPVVAIALIEHMGDIVAAEPIARLARRQFPTGYVCWITHVPYASLPNSYPEVDHVIEVRCLSEWMLLQKLDLFDVIWDLHINGRVCPQCGIRQIKLSYSPNEQNYYEYGSLLDVQCASAGLPKLNEGPIITPPPAAVAAVDALALPFHFLVIHCVSNDPQRHWPEAKWRELIARVLSVCSLAVVEVGSRPAIILLDSAQQLSVCGKLSVLETAEVIRRADLFIGIDSGPAHLANAVGTPGVILLGAYRSFERYMPYNGGYATGENAEIVRTTKGTVAELSVDAAFSAVMARIRSHQLHSTTPAR